MVEQLVEVPTQQQPAEQNVDIPVPGARLRGDLQGFLTGQGSTGSRVSVAKGGEHSEAVSVAAKAGKYKIASQKTGASSRGARVAGPQGFHTGQGSTAPRGADFRPQSVCKRFLEIPVGWTGVRLW